MASFNLNITKSNTGAWTVTGDLAVSAFARGGGWIELTGDIVGGIYPRGDGSATLSGVMGSNVSGPFLYYGRLPILVNIYVNQIGVALLNGTIGANTLSGTAYLPGKKNFSISGDIPPFTIMTSLPGLHTWFDPTQLTGLSDGALVSTYTDATGHGHNATAAGGNRPTYKTNIKNGNPVVRCLLNSNVMQTAAFTALPQPNTIFFVGKVSDYSLGQAFFDGIGGSNRHYMDSPAGSGIIRLNAGITDALNGDPTVWNIYSILFNGAGSILRINGVPDVASVGTNSLTGITLFGNFTPGAAFTGDSGDYILATGDRSAYFSSIETILRTKWGTP